MTASPDLMGDQRPRVLSVPPIWTSVGKKAVALAEFAGLKLDPWQQFVLEQGLGQQENGKWSAFEVALLVSRQNGKGAVFEARELAGLFLLGEELIIHTAHEFKTAQEAFRRVLALVQNTPELNEQVARIRTSHGEEGIELVTGQRLRFLARSGGSGRGFSGDCIILDEAMILGEDAMGALLPTMSARPNPQLWYGASAGIGTPSTQLARVRERGLSGKDPSLAYFEWSIDPHVSECQPGCTEHDDLDDPRSWAKANPGFGIRITEEHVARELPAMGAEVFERERLGVGTYPVLTGDAWRVIGEEVWRALVNGASRPADPVAFAVDTTPERSHTAIGVAGANGDAKHAEVVDHRPGTGWVADRVAELVAKWKPCALVIDEGGPAGSLIAGIRRALEENGAGEGVGLSEDEIDELLIIPKARQVGAACGQFYDAVADQTLVHLDQAPLTTALAGADRRPIGDGWAWARRGVSVDISPLVAVTLAVWGHTERAHVEPEGAPNLWL